MHGTISESPLFCLCVRCERIRYSNRCIHIFDPAPILSVFQNELYWRIASRCPPATHLHCVCVCERTWHVLVHIWTFDSKSIVDKLRIHGSRAYRQRQLRISYSFSFFLFTFHILLFLSAAMTMVTRRTQNIWCRHFPRATEYSSTRDFLGRTEDWQE